MAAPTERLGFVVDWIRLSSSALLPAGYDATRYVGKNAMWLLHDGANPELLLNISAGSARSYRGRGKAGAYV